MSLTATLLLNRPIRLPRGRKRLVSSDFQRKNESARNSTTRLANVELVFNAIVDGHTTIRAIEDAIVLSRLTVQKALNELEAWPSGPRIVRITAGKHQPHRFQIVSPDQGD